MHSTKISLDRYREICSESDISPNYHPDFVDFYFSQLGERCKIIGRFDDQGRLIAAYPVLFGQVFPNSLHKRLLGQGSKRLGDIGQPEALFPVGTFQKKISLNYFSPITSPILKDKIRAFGKFSLKGMAIAKERKHKKLTHRKKIFLQSGGSVYFTDSIDRNDFAEIFIKLHCTRWGYSPYDLRYVREQITKLYNNIFGVILCKCDEPIAAQLCYKSVGRTLFYVDFINSGVKIEKNDNETSYGSIMMLLSLRKAEETSASIGKILRYSFGYYYGEQDYKAVWTEAEETLIGF